MTSKYFLKRIPKKENEVFSSEKRRNEENENWVICSLPITKIIVIRNVKFTILLPRHQWKYASNTKTFPQAQRNNSHSPVLFFLFKNHLHVKDDESIL